MSHDFNRSPVRVIIHTPDPGGPDTRSVRFVHDGPFRVSRSVDGRIGCLIHYQDVGSLFALVMNEDVARRLAEDILVAIDGDGEDFDDGLDEAGDGE